MMFQTICIFCVCVMYLWKRNQKQKQAIIEAELHPPDLSGKIPVFGHVLKVVGDPRHAFNLIRSTSEEMWQTGREVLTFCAGPQRKYYILSDPDDCSLILNVCLEKNYYYSFIKPLLGNGLTFAEVPVWKQHRKFMNPAFKQQSLNEFLVVFNGEAKHLIDKLRTEVDKGNFNHEKYLKVTNLESTCMTAFGTDIKEFGGLQTEYLDSVQEIFKIYMERFQKIWLHTDIVYNFTTLKKREDVLIKRIKKFATVILNKRKAEMEEHTSIINESGQCKPFMTQLLDESRRSGLYTEDDVISEVNTLVTAAYDTTAQTAAIALILLGYHQEVQQKAYDEIQEVFQNSTRDVNKDDLSKLHYVDAIFKETLRLYPVAPIISRYIEKDIRPKNYYLKAGNSAVINFWALHRHPKWGPDANLFKPERWLDPTTLPKNSNYFAGFSLGKRGCIGKTYAMMSMKTMLVHLLRSYVIKSEVTELELLLESDIFLRLIPGQHISIEERKINEI